MRTLEDLKVVKRVLEATGIHVTLSEYDSVRHVDWEDEIVRLALDVYEVRRTHKRDYIENHGVRLLFIKLVDSQWTLDTDMTSWDESFEPYILEHYGRRQSALEVQEQREFEQMCWRPGNARNPLDSYARVWSDKSTPKMEKYW